MRNLERLIIALVVASLLLYLAVFTFVQSQSGQAPQPSTGTSFKFVSWNVESGGNDPDLIASQIAELQCDILALSEVSKDNASKYASAFRSSDLAYYQSHSGGSDRLLIAWDCRKFHASQYEEMDELNDGNHRSPLFVRLKEYSTGTEFIVMTNHLARRDKELRRQQAIGLREWARDSTVPIIAIGDFNFDYSFERKRGNESFNEFMRDGIWEWVRPAEWIDTNWAGNGEGKDRYPDSMLDFAFVANGAKAFRNRCRVIVRDGDFPDDDNTSDHRPIELTVEIDR